MPERILYYDCSAGISGDMHLGALVDIGVPAEHLVTELKKLGLEGWELRFCRDSRKGVGGTRADVILSSETPTHTHEGPAAFSGIHSHGDFGSHSHEGDQPMRPHREIIEMIRNSSLAEGVKRRSLDIFACLAAAEAKVHGVSEDEVVFHEVGAVDSIVDIVGAAIGLEWLKPDRVLVSTVELGSGFVRCAHGRLPVPAPATVEILQGVPVRRFAVPFEATTPTGAAILSASADAFTDAMDFTIEKTGYGIGHKDGSIPNLLRLFLATPIAETKATAAAPAFRDEAVVLECNLDDMTGEACGHVLNRLIDAGASDAWITPILMKKSRPAQMISVLCSPGQEEALARILLSETTTFGIRRRTVAKLALERSFKEHQTSLGSIRVKTALLEGRPLKWKFEYEDLRRIAEERKLPLREVEERLRAEISRQDTD